MVYVGQGTMRRISYLICSLIWNACQSNTFDTHAQVISCLSILRVDTLRQLISQSIPQVINSVFFDCGNIYKYASFECSLVNIITFFYGCGVIISSA